MISYKNIIRSQENRIRLLNALSFVPDKPMIELQYTLRAHRLLNLNNPIRYTEKLQWYKLYYRDEVMTECVDKHRAKGYVERKLGTDEYTIPEFFCWKSVDDIDFDAITDNCILKTSNGTGTNIFIKDVESIDRENVKQQLKTFFNRPRKSVGREWAYYDVEPAIICEPIIEPIDQAGDGLDDYKFFCFDGHVAMKWVDYDRFVDHKRVLYTAKGKRLDVECTYKSPKSFEYPAEAFDVLQPIAEKLAEGFPHVRVDLYYTGGRAYFGELTFYSGSGYEFFSDDRFDIWLGEKFILSSQLK